MVRVKLPSSKPTSKDPSKNLGISKPPISKKPKGKEKKGKEIVILHVKSDSSGRHYGRTSLDPTRYIIAPSSVSRADGDLEKDSPPTSPRANDDNIFTKPKPYEFEGAIRFRFPKDAALHTALTDKGKWPIPLLFPEIDDLKKLEVFDEIKELLYASGLNFVFRDDPGSYHEVTMEFLSSFNAVHRIGIDKEEGEVKCWRFALGDLQWEVDATVLCDWFRLPRDGLVPEIVDADIYEFWKKITGNDYAKEDQHKSTSIRVPKWSIIHKFLGGIVFVRSNYGRLVSKLEIMIMLMMERGQKVDWLWCITSGIKDNQNTTSRNTGLGGGSFVTWIARKLNFTFGNKQCDKLVLGLKKMRSMHILGKGLKWKNAGKGDEAEFGDEEEMNTDDEIDGFVDPDLPSSSQAVPPPSTDPSLAQILSRLDSLAREQSALATYVSQHNQWKESTLLAIAAHLGIASSISLPPRSPFIPRSPSPPSPPIFPSTKGNEKMGEPSNVQKNGEENCAENDEDSPGDQFIIAPRGVPRVVPEEELGVSIDEIDRADDVRVDDPSTAPSTPGEGMSTSSKEF